MAIALAVGVVGNVLSRTVVLDAAALWPLAALVVPALLVGLRGGRSRALAPLMLLTWMLVSVGLHLGAMEGLPSSAASVEVDMGTAQTGRLVASVPDVALVVRPGGFQVRPAPTGGSAGAPVVERVAGASAVSLVLTDDPALSPWYRFGRYDVRLPEGIIWDLRLRAADLDLDLRDLAVGGGRLEAVSGRVMLGAPIGEVVLEIDGNVDVEIPAGVPAAVVGSVRVPEGWIVEGDSAVAPVEGVGWRIVVVSGSVRITTR